MNGGAAHLIKKGECVTIMAFGISDQRIIPVRLVLNPSNEIIKSGTEPDPRVLPEYGGKLPLYKLPQTGIVPPPMEIAINLVIIAHVVVSLLLVLVILMQRPKQEGLGAAFGSGMTDAAWGARTTDVLQKGTVY